MDYNLKEDPRHPWTHSADLIRSVGGYDKGGVKLDRMDASQIRQLFSKVLNLDDLVVAEKLSEYYIQNMDEISQKSADEFLKSRGR